jgi:hypothetical protein
MLSCECDYGFDCSYTKSIQGKVVLPIAPEDFDEIMRNNFILSIAESAGVSPDRVKIIAITSYTPLTTREVGRRHSKKEKKERKTQIQVRVVGATRVKNTEKNLKAHGVTNAPIKAYFSRGHHVEARRRPKQ